MEHLDEALIQYSRSEVYPFHMPGHKRRGIFASSSCQCAAKNNVNLSGTCVFPSTMDITEIDGFDNLHHAAGILNEAQQRAARLYGAEQSFYLVNGSTCGILASVCVMAPKRSKVLMARNCHKSVYHALFLQELTPEYLYPAVIGDQILGQITPKQVDDALRRQPETAVVIITSPTYEGILSDVKSIAEVAHDYGVPLLVDAAHGAHLGFGGGFPESPVRQGADAVVMSLHKTLPSLTQTALLHVCSDRLSIEQVKKYLAIFETSSPSYLLMAGMDACIRRLRTEGNMLFADYRGMLERFYRQTEDLRWIHVMTKADFSSADMFDWDDSKIVIFVRHTAYDGPWLHRRLLGQYRLQSEMVSARYVLLMTSIMDVPEGFLRLAEALRETDAWLAKQDVPAVQNCLPLANLYQKNDIKMPIYQAESGKAERVSLEDAVNRISADTVYLYPPGIPALVPGEVITEGFLRKLCACQEAGLLVEGITGNGINVVCLDSGMPESD